MMIGTSHFSNRNHIAVVDLGFGDSGKGILVARLCADDRGPKLVVKANGGSQCAHNVITDEGQRFTFAQFGSGTFSRVPTYLAKDFLFEPFSLLHEAERLEEAGVEKPLSLMHVAWNALMTTPYHAVLNQWQEDQRGEGRHGSTGRGIGATAWYALEYPEDALTASDLHSASELYTKLINLRSRVIGLGVSEDRVPKVAELFEWYTQISDDIHVVGSNYFQTEFRVNKVIFEGSQGVLLDEHYGFHPHTTWSQTTDTNARSVTAMFDSDLDRPLKVTTIGVVRTYTTRHGAGPFVTESDDVQISEPYNGTGKYQGSWRQGNLDLHALRYAISVCERVDGIYVTHTDSVARQPVKWCESYELDGEPYAIQAYASEDHESRQRQTESLYKATPVLRDAPGENVAQALAEALERPLYGHGDGPHVGQGEFLKKASWY